MPQVTVFIPVYNKASYLKECLDSVLNQEYKDFEILLVDDVSTDNSVEIINSYHHSSLRLIRNQKNMGPGGCSNMAIEEAHGKYLVRMDADDISPLNRLSLQVKYMEDHPEIVASSGNVQCFGADNGLWKYPHKDKEAKASMLFSTPVCQGACIMRLDQIRKSGVRYGSVSNYIGEDRVFWFDLRKKIQFGNLNEVVLHYRRGSQNIAHDKNFNRIEIRKNIIRYMMEHCGFSVTENDIEFHLMATGIFPEKLNESHVKGLKEWLEKLNEWNNASGEFPPDAFFKKTEQIWDAFFFRVLKEGVPLTRFYFSLCAQIKPEHRKYFLKYRINRWIGRKK